MLSKDQRVLSVEKLSQEKSKRTVAFCEDHPLRQQLLTKTKFSCFKELSNVNLSKTLMFSL